MKKALLTFVIMATMVGCSAEIEMNLPQTMRVISSVVDFESDMTEITSSDLETLYSITNSDYVQFAGSISLVGTSTDEVILIEAKDSASKEKIKENLEARLQSKIKSAEGYLPKEVEKLASAQVRVDGNYIALLATDDMDTLINVYQGEMNEK